MFELELSVPALAVGGGAAWKRAWVAVDSRPAEATNEPVGRLESERMSKRYVSLSSLKSCIRVGLGASIEASPAHPVTAATHAHDTTPKPFTTRSATPVHTRSSTTDKFNHGFENRDDILSCLADEWALFSLVRYACKIFLIFSCLLPRIPLPFPSSRRECSIV